MPTRPSLARTGTAAAAGLLVMLLGVACSSDDGDAGGEATTTVVADTSVTVTAQDSPTLDFEPETVETTAGAVEIVLENDGSIPHTLVIEDEGGFKLSVGKKGSVDRGTTELEPGTYALYCDVPGHRASGDKMETTLTVT